MIRIVLVLAASVLIGCNSTGSGENQHPIPQGIYESQSYKTDPSIGMYQVAISSAGLYEYKSYYNGCMECEGSGEWLVSAGLFKTTNKKGRCRDACDVPFGDYLDRPSTSEKIRNISTKGFELWSEPTETFPGSWEQFKAL